MYCTAKPTAGARGGAGPYGSAAFRLHARDGRWLLALSGVFAFRLRRLFGGTVRPGSGVAA